MYKFCIRGAHSGIPTCMTIHCTVRYGCVVCSSGLLVYLNPRDWQQALFVEALQFEGLLGRDRKGSVLQHMWCSRYVAHTYMHTVSSTYIHTCIHTVNSAYRIQEIFTGHNFHGFRG